MKFYIVEGTLVDSLEEVAEVLGKNKVTRKQLQKLGVEELEAESREEADNIFEGNVDDTPEPEPTPEPKKGKAQQKGKAKAKDAEADVKFEDEAELKSVVASMPNGELVEWAKQLGIELKHYDDDKVMRMRTAMALKNHYFPRKATGGKATTSSRSPYAGLTTKQLEKLCKDNKLEYRKVKSNEGIQRMWLIKALKDGGVEAV